MTNGEKYKSVKERTEAFDAFCDSHGSNCEGCPLEKACDDGTIATFAWLELEADEEKPLPCPFCGRPVLVGSDKFSPLFDVTCDLCEYTSKAYGNRDEAIAAHNRVARAVMEANDKEAK